MQDILDDCQYYWVTAQSEYSTDLLFKSRRVMGAALYLRDQDFPKVYLTIAA